MSLKDHVVYWLLPSAITLLYIFIYFFDILGLREVVAPEINREFGLVENTQLIILLIIIYFSVQGFRNWNTKFLKWGFMVMAVAAGVLFLEEIDYGLHYVDYFTGRTKEELAHEIVVERKVRNIHNNGNLTSVMKMISYIIIILFFVLLPLLPQKVKEKYPFLNFIRPSRKIITTAISLLVLNQIALFLFNNYNYTNRSLDGNVSEFEEIMTYYIVLLYAREMANKPKMNDATNSFSMV